VTILQWALLSGAILAYLCVIVAVVWKDL